jgi:hypothetical protein
MDGVVYRTNDLTRWGVGGGSGTGGNLTPVEVDLNFWELYTRLKNLEDNPPVAVSITGMTVVGTQWQVNMSDGSHFGPFTLPLATFQLKGDWQNGFHYFELDIIVVDGVGLFLVRIEHTTPALPAVFDPLADDGSGHLLYLKLFGEGPRIYDFGFFAPGNPGEGVTGGEYLFAHLFARGVVLGVGLVGSIATLQVPPAADLSMDLQKNGSNIGTLTFLAGVATGSFTFASEVIFTAGDVFGVVVPALDDDARQLNITITGLRS